MTLTTHRPPLTRSEERRGNRTGAGNGDTPVCCSCGQPIRSGEPHWAGDAQNRAWHYGCAERAGVTLTWNRIRQRMAAGASR